MLRPQLRVAYNDSFDGKTLRELLELVEANRECIEAEPVEEQALDAFADFPGLHAGASLKPGQSLLDGLDLGDISPALTPGPH